MLCTICLEACVNVLLTTVKFAHPLTEGNGEADMRLNSWIFDFKIDMVGVVILGIAFFSKITYIRFID